MAAWFMMIGISGVTGMNQHTEIEALGHQVVPDWIGYELLPSGAG